MKGFGFFLAIVGAMVLCYALFIMDVSGGYHYGVGEVANLDLMNRRTNYTVFGGLLLVVGLVMATLAKSAQNDGRKCPHCAELIKVEASKCKHCGEVVEPVAAEINKANIGFYNVNTLFTHGTLNKILVVQLAEEFHRRAPAESTKYIMRNFVGEINRIVSGMGENQDTVFSKELENSLLRIKKH